MTPSTKYMHLHLISPQVYVKFSWRLHWKGTAALKPLLESGIVASFTGFASVPWISVKFFLASENLGLLHTVNLAIAYNPKEQQQWQGGWTEIKSVFALFWAKAVQLPSAPGGEPQDWLFNPLWTACALPVAPEQSCPSQIVMVYPCFTGSMTT